MTKGGQWLVAGLLLAAFAGLRVYYVPLLPPHVAQNFDAAGRPNGFVSAHSFWTFSSVMMLVMLASLHGLSLLIPRFDTKWLNVPNRDYWFVGERRSASIAYVQLWMLAYGNAVLAFMLVLYWRVIVANIERAPLSGFGSSMVALLVVTVVAVVAMMRRFPRPT